jgi:hypothetical protein
MPIRGLLAAGIALVIAAGLVWWSNKRGTDPRIDENPKLFDLADADITRIELRRAGGETTILERDAGGRWAVTAPAAYAADSGAVQSLVGSLAKLNAEKAVEERVEDFGEFGLKEPGFIALVTTKDGTLHTIMVGDDVPAVGGHYVRKAGDERLYTVAAFTKTSIDKSSADLRDKRLLPFGENALAKLELRTSTGSVEFGRNAAGDWQIVKPEPLRADGWQVEELIRRIREAQLDPSRSEADQKKNEMDFARAAPLATVNITAGVAAQSLEVRRTADNRYLARSSVVPGVHLLSNDTGEGLDKSAADFRTKKLFDFGFAEPSRVEFKGPEGARTFVREDANWNESGKTMDTVGVQSLIDRLRDLTAESFPTSGFTTPEIEAAISTGEGEKASTEKIQISRAGGKFLARREGEPALYELRADAVEELTKAARDVKEPPAPDTGKGKK